MGAGLREILSRIPESMSMPRRMRRALKHETEAPYQSFIFSEEHSYAGIDLADGQ